MRLVLMFSSLAASLAFTPPAALRACTRALAQRHIVGELREVVDPELSRVRRKALEEALRAQGIDPAGLESDPSLVGSSALKCFNSFVLPRPTKIDHARSENLAAASARTAYQVSFLVRQKRAELADYLRNTDRAAGAREAAGLALQPLKLVLDNVRSAYNVGSILRTAETAGCAEVICCGYTPVPPHEKLEKTAMGAEETVPTRHFSSTLAALKALRAEGFTVYAMETTSKSQCYSRVAYPPKTALVLGNEVTGVDTAVMDLCDGLVEIPTYGLKNSLNVASAAPVVVFEVLRQWGATDKPSSAL